MRNVVREVTDSNGVTFREAYTRSDIETCRIGNTDSRDIQAIYNALFGNGVWRGPDGSCNIDATVRNIYTFCNEFDKRLSNLETNYNSNLDSLDDFY